MKTLFYLTFIVNMSFVSIIAQNKSYKSFLLDKEFYINNNHTKFINFIENSNVENFLFYDKNNNLEYSLIITKKKDSINFHKEKDINEFKSAYLEKCKCSIESSIYIGFKKIMVYRLKTKISIKSSQNEDVYGYVDSFMLNGYLYSLVFLTNGKKKFEIFKSDYNSILSTIDE